MASADGIDEFLARVSPDLTNALAANEGPRSLLVHEDSGGVHVADVGPTGRGPHDLIGAHVDDGATGAAYASYLPDRGEVVAEILMRQPRFSDIRRARVDRNAGGVTLGEWEYGITG